MRILILGGDGYLGWPTALHFSQAGHEVTIVDNFAKRKIALEEGVEPLFPIPTLQRRVKLWKEVTGLDINLRIGDLLNHRFAYRILRDTKPDAAGCACHEYGLLTFVLCGVCRRNDKGDDYK